ncbi:MAG: DUF3662 domain-containing protein [Anaerolineales bacterium]|nr:DUF3662 domain-containing protein [Anaerolineales bacterium]MCB8962691.1 DUF3662 domain-containing protein [Ardenticatenales bacterium]
MRKSVTPFANFEAFAQRLIEGSWRQLFGGHLEPLDVVTRLAHAMEDGREGINAPDFYQVYLNSDDHEQIMTTHPELPEQLSLTVSAMAAQAGLDLRRQPKVTIRAELTLPRREVQITASHEPYGEGATAVRTRSEDMVLSILREIDAFLIVEGRHVPLDRPVVTIGRRADNDIVLESQSVSRQHAQLRWRYGRFVIYDLGSRAGTTVNGQAVTEWALQPGDIIVINHSSLIYGEGNEAESRRRHRPVDEDAGEQTLVMQRPTRPNRPD